MKKTKKLLSLLIAGALMLGLSVSVSAEGETKNETTAEAGWTHEAVLYEDDFSGDTPLWFNYNSMNNDKRILTINAKQFDWNAQDYTGWFYENVAHITTLNVAPFENRMSKRYVEPGNGAVNTYLFPNRLAENFKIETEYNIEHYLQRVTPAEGEYSLKTVISNDKHALVYSLERDGVWVLNEEGTWVKKLSLENAGGRWHAVANVEGNEAKIVFTYADAEYDVEYTIPTLEVSGEAINDYYYGTKVLEQTTNEAGESTFENFAVYDIDYCKVSNVYDDFVLVDDMKSEKDFVTYSNLGVREVDSMICGSSKRLLLTNTTAPGVVKYDIPESTKITDFTVVKLQNAEHQSTMSFYLTDANGSRIEIPNNWSEIAGAGLFENREYLGGGFVYYYEANAALKQMLADGNYVSMEAWVWVDQGTTADGLFPSLAYAQVKYDRMEDMFDQENQPIIPTYNKDNLISDDLAGSSLSDLKWHAFRIGLINQYNDAIQKIGDNVLFMALGTPTISPKLSKTHGSDDTHVLAKNIGDNFEFRMDITTHQFLMSGNPDTTGNLSTYAKVTNGKKILYFSIERDGVWAYTSNNKWEKIIDNKMIAFKDYSVKAIVTGSEARLYLMYVTEFGKSRIYEGTYQLSDDGALDEVSMGILYDNAQEGGDNSVYYLNSVELNNISEKNFQVDDSSKDVEWVTYDANIERSEVGAIYGSATHQYDLIDPTNNGTVSYAPDGYIRDFSITRRLGGTYQGDMTLMATYEDGSIIYLTKGVDFKEEVGGWYNNGHLYYLVPTDAYKEFLKLKNLIKLDVVLLVGTESFPANEIYPGLVSASFELDKIPDLVIGEHLWQTNTLKGVTSFVVDFTKTTSGTLKVLPVIASYDEEGRLIEVYQSEVQEFNKGDNFALSAGPIENGATVKAFLWNADTMQPLCEAFIK